MFARLLVLLACVGLASSLSIPQESFSTTSASSRAAPLDPYPSQPLLSFGASTPEKFKLLIITDTHLLDDQTVPGNASNVSRASTDAVRQYLEVEKPDYVVHLGDLVSGEVANSSAQVRDAVRQILGPAVEKQIPFSTTKGNHDNDVYSTHGQITDYEHELAPQLTYTRKAPAGVGGGSNGEGSDNYWVPIYPSKDAPRGSKPALVLWFFDSRSGKQLKSEGNGLIDDWVDSSVAGWINSEVSQQEKAWGSVLPPSLLFVHIPIQSTNYTQNLAPYSDEVGGVTDERPESFTSEGKRYEGLNVDKPLNTQGHGGEAGQYNGQDLPFLNAITKGKAGKSRLHAIVSGHDHGNDWCAPSNVTTAAAQVLPLCFGKHSGFGGYDYDPWNHGARIFEFDLDSVDKSVRTYIRMLTGETRYDTLIDDAWAKTS
ncbi:Metallo-dependent phosphatase [Acaromyces ingoldii]|uniref:Metallo-dependent phosphatase n=1 Tax=Acaromyces ingoldii TaxID=215250 RepID=A0A316YVT5_9BASI|nr:Metallo-dependent phosphatase [Acaromyces ingoldii]PWN93389.1 Metallo-dependent phosphatase [Acaromyces ingoldii]